MAKRYILQIEIDEFDEDTNQTRRLVDTPATQPPSFETLSGARAYTRHLAKYVIGQETFWRYRGQLWRQVSGLGKGNNIVIENLEDGDGTVLTIDPTIDTAIRQERDTEVT